jgi:hypothetical protein
MEIIAGPAIEKRAARPYLGIGIVTPFRGMLSVRDRLWAETFEWLDRHGIREFGSAFMRFNVIDMRGSMDMEVGVETPHLLEGDERVRPGQFLAGEYATFAYREHSVPANRTLIQWTAEQGREFDRHDDVGGDRFACRYELNLTDPRTEPRKKRWIVELNFLLRPRQALKA